LSEAFTAKTLMIRSSDLQMQLNDRFTMMPEEVSRCSGIEALSVQIF